VAGRNQVGPSLAGIVGRKAGQVPNFGRIEHDRTGIAEERQQRLELKKRAAHIDVEAVIEVLRRFRFKRGNRGNASIEEHAVKVVNVFFDFVSEQLCGGWWH
jgi:hypothetical protein